MPENKDRETSPPPSFEEIRAIVLEEYAFWRGVKSESPDAIPIALGAMAAASNILAAITLGKPISRG